MLTYRLNILNDVVDYFVIVESTHTFSGKEKVLYYQDNLDIFSAFKDKIIHVIVDNIPYKYPNINYANNEQWKNETFQRNRIHDGIKQIELNDDDIIIIADVDEIPNPDIVKKMKSGEIYVDVNSLETDLYYYNLNSKISEKWYHMKVVNYRKYMEMALTCNIIRENHYYSRIANGGWHLSYFGDSNFIKNKLENFSHQEYNNDTYTNCEKIENHIKNGDDLFDRPENVIERILIKNNRNLPPEYETYLNKFIFE
jgi:beta-1,4-mannosyl-glycoprotein beta-1,4-N-acetylglucosaminyltransferase